MSRTCSISTMIHHEFHPKRESTIFHHMFTYPSKILRCSTQKSRDGPRTSPDFSAFSRFPSMEAATQLSALLRTTEALARYGAQRRVAVALQCRMRQKWQRKKYLVTWQLGEVMWGYVFIILEDYILNFHSLFMSHTLLDSSLFIFIHLYSSLFIFTHLYSSLFTFIHQWVRLQTNFCHWKSKLLRRWCLPNPQIQRSQLLQLQRWWRSVQKRRRFGRLQRLGRTNGGSNDGKISYYPLVN